MESDDSSRARIGSARNQARKVLAELAVQSTPIVVNDVLKHLRKSYDITVTSWSFGSKTSGVQTNDGESCVIAYNKTQHPHHQRFTVAHELGHFLLGHTNYLRGYDLKSKDPAEIEANQFAAELLMPLKFLKQDLQSGIIDPKILAVRYNVSEEAMWWQISRSNLLKLI